MLITICILLKTVGKINLYYEKGASFIVSAKPPSPTSRGSSAGSSNLGTSLYPAHKARDVCEVVLAETMNEAEKGALSRASS